MPEPLGDSIHVGCARPAVLRLEQVGDRRVPDGVDPDAIEPDRFEGVLHDLPRSLLPPNGFFQKSIQSFSERALPPDAIFKLSTVGSLFRIDIVLKVFGGRFQKRVLNFVEFRFFLIKIS